MSAFFLTLIFTTIHLTHYTLATLFLMVAKFVTALNTFILFSLCGEYLPSICRVSTFLSSTTQLKYHLHKTILDSIVKNSLPDPKS